MLIGGSTILLYSDWLQLGLKIWFALYMRISFANDGRNY